MTTAAHAKDNEHGTGSASRAWFDTYSVRAHWAPVLALTSPVLFGLVAAFPTLQSWHGAAASAGLATALPPVLGQFARNMGKRIEPRLWAKWGGPPTTRLLRHRDCSIREPIKQRYFETLAKSLGLARPSEADEAANPEGADDVYESATAWLRRQTRHAKPGDLVAGKNAAYGMQRNLLGLRAIGIFGTSLATAGLIGLTAWQYLHGQSLSALLLAGCAVNACALLFWVTAVSSGAVRSAADAYGLAILECLEPSGSVSRAPKPKKSTAEAAVEVSPPKTTATPKRKRSSPKSSQSPGEPT